MFLPYLSLLPKQDDEVGDILTRAMTGEIAVGSYHPLPSLPAKESSRISTTPIPARSGRGGVIQSAEVTRRRPISSGKTKVDNQLQEHGDIFDVGESTSETENKEVISENLLKKKAALPSDEDVMMPGKEVEAVSHYSEEVVPRRENSKLRELLRAIESYDRYSKICCESACVQVHNTIISETIIIMFVVCPVVPHGFFFELVNTGFCG